MTQCDISVTLLWPIIELGHDFGLYLLIESLSAWVCFLKHIVVDKLVWSSFEYQFILSIFLKQCTTHFLFGIERPLLNEFIFISEHTRRFYFASFFHKISQVCLVLITIWVLVFIFVTKQIDTCYFSFRSSTFQQIFFFACLWVVRSEINGTIIKYSSFEPILERFGVLTFVNW